MEPVPAPVIVAPTFGQSVAGIADKVFWTFVQTLFGYLLLQNVLDISSGQAAVLAGIASGVNTLIALAPVSIGGNPYVDLLYRVVRTYGIAFVTPLIASGILTLDVVAWKYAAAAALPAAFSLLKGFAATRLGDTNSAALLPAKLDPTLSILPTVPPGI